MNSTAFQPLPEPPSGFRYYRSAREILHAQELLPYQHVLMRAWDKNEMGLSAVLTLNGIPTVYVHDSKRPMKASEVAVLQCKFWNQGLATVLLLREPGRLRVFSSMEKPCQPDTATDKEIEDLMVESFDLATQAAWAERFYLEIGTGHYYSKPSHLAKFDPRETVDSYLIDNLEAVRDQLTSGLDALSPAMAHAFLGRILFACYLCHRGIIQLDNYLSGGPWQDIGDLLARSPAEKIIQLLYDKLFPKLKGRFNGSMFDEDLSHEQDLIKPRHLDAVRHFLEGSEVKKGQRKLGFWAYRFDFIPVETISSIYEKFLDHEDASGKRKLGAYYTPRLLAEMTLDLALRNRKDIRGLRFIDPSCGSGIFLVLAFNRLVARWNADQRKKPSVTERAEALRTILSQLRGVDMNLTACRIACFSLYLAFLDQFDPSDVEEYIETTGDKLPNLLVAKSHGFKKATIPVIWERDFFDVADDWHGKFDVVVGNPPWGERGTKQLANPFVEKSPAMLADGGRAALVLPSKIFLNNKTDAFQRRWLSAITLETMVQLADYRFILFKEAKCPACIVGFTAQPPAPDHEIEYIAPKVSLIDLRDGLIPVSPQDRKWIPLAELLDREREDPIGVAWKTRLWGTPRDQKLLDYLLGLPRLSELTGLASAPKQAEGKRWIAGQGCKPRKKNSNSQPDRDLKDFGLWSADDRFVSPDDLDGLAFVRDEACVTLGKHFENEGYLLGQLYSKPPECLFSGPLVLLNQGFSQAAFSKGIIRFQHSLQSFSNPKGGDEDALLFLAGYLRSKLARYAAFHTSANLATERDKVHLDEVLRLPFFLPDHPDINWELQGIFRRIVATMRSEEGRLENSARQFEKEYRRKQTDLFQEEEQREWTTTWLTLERKMGTQFRQSLDPLIYEYFGLTPQDIALVDDTCEIFDKGDTPPSLESARFIPTLSLISAAEGLESYATMISQTLNGWASGPLKVTASGAVDAKTGYALVELQQSKEEKPYHARQSSAKVLEAAQRLQEASVETMGGSICFHRSGWYFDGKRILIVKPARLGEWTRTAALNDAAALYAEISETRHSKQT